MPTGIHLEGAKLKFEPETIYAPLISFVFFAGTIYYNLSGLKQHKLTVFQFQRSQVNESDEAKIKMLVGLVCSGDFRGESLPSICQLLEAIAISWLMATSLQSPSPSSHLLL